MHTFFLRFQSRKNLLTEVPQVGDSISGPASHLWRPRAIVVLGVHRGAFREQKLCSLDVAVEGRPVQRRAASGGFPGRDSEDADGPGNDESCGNAELGTRSTDKRTMNVSGLNIFKTVQGKKTITNNSQTHSTSFNTSCFQQITFNETMSINMVYFHKLKRLFKTISSSKSNSEQLIT